MPRAAPKEEYEARTVPEAEGKLREELEKLAKIEEQVGPLAKAEADQRGVVFGLLKPSQDARWGAFIAQRTKDKIVLTPKEGTWQEVVKKHNFDPERFRSTKLHVTLPMDVAEEIAALYRKAKKKVPECIGSVEPVTTVDNDDLLKVLAAIGEGALTEATTSEAKPGQLRTRWKK